MPKERQILITKEGNIRRIEILLSYNGLDHDPPCSPLGKVKRKVSAFYPIRSSGASKVLLSLRAYR